MCCSLIAMLFGSPRLAILIILLFSAGRDAFKSAFDTWVWPILGFVFLPWTTLAWLLFYGNNGIAGIDWMWIALGLVGDIVTYSGGAYKRKSVPFYPQNAP